MCGGCGGECPYGVPYGDVLRALMYHDGYGDDSLAKETLAGVIVSSSFEQCSSCSSCAISCRRGLDIRAEMRFAREVLA